MRNREESAIKKTCYENRTFLDLKFSQKCIENQEFIDCRFEHCTFEECQIKNCRFTECKFNSCTILTLRTRYSASTRCEFTSCSLIGIHWSEISATGKIFEPIQKIKDCHIKYNSLVKMNFKKFDFSENIIQETTFEECSLADSSFMNCRLDATQFSDCDLRNADFRGACGYQIDITTNQMKGAKFSFPEVVCLLDVLDIQID